MADTYKNLADAIDKAEEILREEQPYASVSRFREIVEDEYIPEELLGNGGTYSPLAILDFYEEMLELMGGPDDYEDDEDTFGDEDFTDEEYDGGAFPDDYEDDEFTDD
jgi:hypothetical protein